MGQSVAGTTLATAEVAGRLLLAFVFGALAGVERQWHHKNAGLRTHTLVAVGVAHVTWRVLSSERAARRLGDLMRTGAVPASFLANLTYGFWARDIGPATVRALVEATNSDASAAAVQARIEFLREYVHTYSDHVPHFQNLILRTIEEATSTKGLNADVWHGWTELAELVVDANPVVIAQQCVAVACRKDFGGYETGAVLKTLKSAVDHAGRAVWFDALAPALAEHPELLWTLDTLFDGRQLLAWFDPDDVLAWAEAGSPRGSEERGKRLRLIASAAPLSGDTLSPLARALVIRYGTERGVLDALEANLGTGGWSGRESRYLKGKLARVERWAQDENAAVRAWVQTVARHLRRAIERARLEEDETGRYESEAGD
jgi:hypothetical protein